MKQLICVLGMFMAFAVNAQSNNELTKHYEAYYAQMKKQGDVQGVINALTHLNVLKPDQGRTDTLAYLYANGRNYLQALNTIGIEKNASDSDLAVEVKAISLKAMNQLPRAIEQYEELNKRAPNPYLAYELADLKIQTNDVTGATTHITYGLANAKDDMKRAFYESQQPYETSLKAAFTYLKGLAELRKDQKNIDGALTFINQALNMDPNFNMARISRDALENRKKQAAAAAKN
ncbi:hypothetical protein ABN763_13835 [Spongiivirga sp. MCCC 1A20706]|uniref:hypothetical protein n=1 Tax=Spongiivirga sp. MCCC 1A20706 TaxID=3160963 RepID=UPI003977883F